MHNESNPITGSLNPSGEIAHAMRDRAVPIPVGKGNGTLVCSPGATPAQAQAWVCPPVASAQTLLGDYIDAVVKAVFYGVIGTLRRYIRSALGVVEAVEYDARGLKPRSHACPSRGQLPQSRNFPLAAAVPLQAIDAAYCQRYLELCVRGLKQGTLGYYKAFRNAEGKLRTMRGIFTPRLQAECRVVMHVPDMRSFLDFTAHGTQATTADVPKTELFKAVHSDLPLLAQHAPHSAPASVGLRGRVQESTLNIRSRPELS